jgi:hypothetical protein
MNIENLKVGMKFKNYKELCETLGEKTKSGASKRSQVDKWEDYFEFKRQKFKYIITKIYDSDQIKLNKKIKQADRHFINRKQKKQFKVDLDNYFKAGVYSITLNNQVYIGSTKCFSRRYKVHYGDKNNNPNTYKMLQEGATFQILWICENPPSDEYELRKILLKKEKELIIQYENDNSYLVENKVYPFGSKKPIIWVKLKKGNNTKVIRVPKDKYKQAVEILKQNNIL